MLSGLDSRSAIEAGVKLAFGTDAGVFPHSLAGRQFGYYVKYGMSPMAAIQSATSRAAELMGWQDRVGSDRSWSVRGHDRSERRPDQRHHPAGERRLGDERRQGRDAAVVDLSMRLRLPA